MKRFLLVIAMPIIALAMVSLAVLVESKHLYNVVSGTPSSIEEWLSTFKDWSVYIIIASTVSGLLWYILAQWLFRLNDWTSAGKRLAWLILISLPAVTTIVAILLTPAVQEGMWWAYFFYLISAIAPYYVGTVLFSPSSFKYTPLGAQSLRRWW
ncbi:MAG: hypothetical protein V1799_18790 [bacterium]